MAIMDAEFTGKMRGPSAIIWLIGASVLIFLLWAKFAWIDEIVRADGAVVSASPPQIIQNLEGGILAELLVTEGQEVEPGQVLARLRDTQFQTTVDDLNDQIMAADIKRLRLEAEMAGLSVFEVPPDIAARNADIVASEESLLAARQADYISRTESAARIMAETQREQDVMEDLLAREIAALIEVTRARNANAEAQAKLDDLVTGAELDRASEYSKTLQDLATLRQNLRIAQDQLSRTVVTSPMRGIVNNMGITTIGGVVRPGEEMFQIIPLGDELFIEARVKPEDIANIVPGQDATIKLSAYDYTIYGSLDATVTVISADTFPDERRADLPPHYKVTLRVDLSHLTERQRQIELRPGMMASVELHTGAKTVLQYLTKPLYRGQEAFRER